MAHQMDPALMAIVARELEEREREQAEMDRERRLRAPVEYQAQEDGQPQETGYPSSGWTAINPSRNPRAEAPPAAKAPITTQQATSAANPPKAPIPQATATANNDSSTNPSPDELRKTRASPLKKYRLKDLETSRCGMEWMDGSPLLDPQDQIPFENTEQLTYQRDLLPPFHRKLSPADRHQLSRLAEKKELPKEALGMFWQWNFSKDGVWIPRDQEDFNREVRKARGRDMPLNFLSSGMYMKKFQQQYIQEIRIEAARAMSAAHKLQKGTTEKGQTPNLLSSKQTENPSAPKQTLPVSKPNPQLPAPVIANPPRHTAKSASPKLHYHPFLHERLSINQQAVLTMTRTYENRIRVLTRRIKRLEEETSRLEGERSRWEEERTKWEGDRAKLWQEIKKLEEEVGLLRLREYLPPRDTAGIRIHSRTVREPVGLPFKSPTLPPDLPPLPTPDEVRACPHVLGELRGKVVAINDQIVVKFGGLVEPWEGQALIYLERHVSDISAPRLYAMYYDSGICFLVMQRIPGESLDKVWPSLTVPEKDGIIAKLHNVFSIMREAKSPWPDTFFGSLDGGPIHHYMFWSLTDGEHVGPFYSEGALVSALTTNYRLDCDDKGWKHYKASYYEKYLPCVLQGHRPTLTHGDVQLKNIILVKNGADAQGQRLFDVVLVDWESAGWCPGFWEIFCASSSPEFASTVWEHDWCWYIHEFLEVYPAETAIMSVLRRDWL